MQGRPDPADALTINTGADVQDLRQKHAGASAPTPSSVYYPSRDDIDVAESDLGADLAPTAAGQHDAVGMDNDYAEVRHYIYIHTTS